MRKARVWFHVTERPIEMTAARSKDESQWTSGKSLLLLYEAQHRQAEGHTTGASHPPTHLTSGVSRRVQSPPAIHFLYFDVLLPFRLSSDPLTSRIWSFDPYLTTICIKYPERENPFINPRNIVFIIWLKSKSQSRPG